MRILITGNMGYVGPTVVRHLRNRFPNAELIGFDAGFFAHCLTTHGSLPETLLNSQHFGDIRDIPTTMLQGVDAVVHLAAISNDPMGKQFEQATDKINRGASVRLAHLAAENGVRNFVFASSCSVYGYAEQGARTELDQVNPLTAYARSKIETEQALKALANGPTIVTCLRFATACGMSDRLRLDLVLNDFVAGAIAAREITVLSDGTPWRPLIDVSDMARAIEWAITRDAVQGGRVLTVNAGSDTWNLRVSDLAEAVAAHVSGTRVSINKEAPPDKRSYKVDFSLFRTLAPQHQPQAVLSQTIERLGAGLSAIGFADPDFRHSEHMRLKVLDSLTKAGSLDADLRWTPSAVGNAQAH
jgi:nucleoside-diphosphate-sugar epimerase